MGFLLMHILTVVSASLIVFIASKSFKILKKSPILRMIIYPVFFCFYGMGLAQSFSFDMFLIFGLEGYVFFQIVNLANTSRRIEFLFNFPCSIQKQSFALEDIHNLSRISSLESSGVIQRLGKKYVVRGNFIYFSMAVISKVTNLLSFKNNA